MKRTEAIKEILQNLIKANKQIGNYTRGDIDKAIIQTRGVDQRTLNNWFRLLWKLEYLIQPDMGFYQLNLVKVAELDLDVNVRFQVDKHQKQLGSFLPATHTHTNSEEEKVR